MKHSILHRCLAVALAAGAASALSAHAATPNQLLLSLIHI